MPVPVALCAQTPPFTTRVRGRKIIVAGSCEVPVRHARIVNPDGRAAQVGERSRRACGGGAIAHGPLSLVSTHGRAHRKPGDGVRSRKSRRRRGCDGGRTARSSHPVPSATVRATCWDGRRRSFRHGDAPAGQQSVSNGTSSEFRIGDGSIPDRDPPRTLQQGHPMRALRIRRHCTLGHIPAAAAVPLQRLPADVQRSDRYTRSVVQTT